MIINYDIFTVLSEEGNLGLKNTDRINSSSSTRNPCPPSAALQALAGGRNPQS
jgi:hypothetical protein